ncbi:LacI family transcriptional regulator [Capsulimonas corticalis]|uniref:LacI family transcriptional regulator n=1 Tax=Capsulimonas corticalis TaxID=2219043 RepID=A0A402CS37_9BACT|nr:LacI family transcriptional regulator [Capsulimonas corticalis]
MGTASKAMNNKGQLKAGTRQRVLQAAEELNFTPNALICSLQRGQTHTIGVFAWPVQIGAVNDITLPLLKGVADGVAGSGRDLLLYSDKPNQFPALTPATFLDGRVDGLILGPTTVKPEAVAMLANAGLPLVVLYNGDVPDSTGSVTIDNAAGVAAAVDHLVELGHRRIVFCGAMMTPDAAERYASYVSSLERHGLPYDSALSVIPDDWISDFEEVCRMLIALPKPPTAIIAGDDASAFPLIEALKLCGKSVPEDISVVGFDDCPAAANSPGLTTVRQPAQEVGQLAGQLISRLLEGAPASECRVTLPVELIIRASTAPPPAG